MNWAETKSKSFKKKCENKRDKPIYAVNVRYKDRMLQNKWWLLEEIPNMIWDLIGCQV